MFKSLSLRHSIAAAIALVAFTVAGAIGAASLSGCSTVPSGSPPGTAPQFNPVATIQAGVAVVNLTVAQLEAAGKLKPADVAKFKAQADAVLATVVAIGPVASLADPKLIPAVQALTALQAAIAALDAAGAPAPVSAPPGGAPA
jgi:hypothetical protein